MSEPSIGEANKMLRVLNGQRLKFTIRVHLPNKEIIEFQADKYPEVKWRTEARSLWLTTASDSYTDVPIMAWPEGAIMLCEENPKV